MKVLLINGSPRKTGNTFIGLKHIANALKEEAIDSEIVQIGNKPIADCIACKKCVQTKRCVFDDIVN